MERLRFMPRDELLRFFRNNKTLMSCMERPHTFLSQLRDHGLIPEHKYKSASVMTNREKLKKALYDILDQFERERPQDIHYFWTCVLDSVIMDQYPTLRKLHNSLMDGSFHFDPQSLEKKRKVPSEDEEAKKRRRSSSSSSDGEQPPPSPQLIPADDVLASTMFKAQLPVTCGDLTGSLSRRRLAEGKRCILFRDQWLTPTQFERRAGRQSSRNWKLSIRCLGRTLGKLMQDGLLTPVKYKGGCKKVHNPLHPSDQTSTDEEETEPEPEAEDDDDDYVVFSVVCGRVDFEAAAEPEELGQDVGHFVEVSDEELTDEQDQLSEDEEKKSHSVWEQSAQLIPDSSIKEEKDAARGWSLPSRLPVVCGDLEGELFTDRLAKGEKCISFQQQWFIPSEFERRAGKKSFKNWKLSIRHRGTPLGKLIQDGRLKSVKYKGGCKKAHKPQRPSHHTVTGGGDESSDRGGGGVFNVTCGALSGVLHAERFASGACGRSIRTEAGWMTPEEFVEESRQSNASWENDIMWNGKALSVLKEDDVLRIKCEDHSDETCKMDPNEMENQKNDDECFVCKCRGSLVLCEHCPRAFHQKCHLPPVDNTDVSDDKPWMCSFCEFKSYKICDELKMEEAMSQNISRHMLTCQYLLLCLCSADQTHSTRLSFVSVANKLQSREYETVGEFVSDVQLIFTNQDGAASLACSQLKELFDAELKEALNILPDA